MIGAFVLTYLGLTGICLGMRRHHEQVFGKGKAPARKALAIAGWCLLALSVVVGVRSGNWAFGLVEWIGFVLAGALLIVFSLAFMPRLCLILPLSLSLLYLII